MASGWQVPKSALECHRAMFEQQLACDVTFQVGPEDGVKFVEIKAHKYMLICRSPVFQPMFIGGLSVADGEGIRVTDVEPEAFRTMLKYMYCEEVKIESYEHGLATIYASKKYLLPRLTSRCVQYLQKAICSSNVCHILDSSLQMDEPDLITKCITYIEDNAETVFAHENFTELSRSALSMILKSDRLNIEEYDIYTACITWAKNEVETLCPDCEKACGKKSATMKDVIKALDHLLYLIRFPNIPLKYIVNEIGPSGIVKQEEILLLVRYKMDSSCPIAPFVAKQRRLLAAQRILVEGFHCKKEIMVNSHKTSVLLMKCTKDTLLQGVNILGGQYKVKLVVMVPEGGQVLGCVERDLSRLSDEECTGSKAVLLDEPVHLLAQEEYSITVTVYGENMYWYRSSSWNDMQTCDNVTIYFIKTGTFQIVHEILFRVQR